MFQEIINKLKVKKCQLQNYTMSNKHHEEKQISFEIKVSKENNFCKMEISDYISIVDYVERMKQVDHFNLEHLISNAVLWNSGKQRVNKGLYYVVSIDNRLYNFWIGDTSIKIDERIRENTTTEEKIITLDTESNDYNYTIHKHDETGNTFYTKFFNNKGNDSCKWNLSTEEFLGSVRPLLDNLENIDNIENIVDLQLMKECILDVSNKKLQKK